MVCFAEGNHRPMPLSVTTNRVSYGALCLSRSFCHSKANLWQFYDYYYHFMHKLNSNHFVLFSVVKTINHHMIPHIYIPLCLCLALLCDTILIIYSHSFIHTSMIYQLTFHFSFIVNSRSTGA